MSVDHGGLEILITHKLLNGHDVIAPFKQAGGEGMPERATLGA